MVLVISNIYVKDYDLFLSWLWQLPLFHFPWQGVHTGAPEQGWCQLQSRHRQVQLAVVRNFNPTVLVGDLSAPTPNLSQFYDTEVVRPCIRSVCTRVSGLSEQSGGSPWRSSLPRCAQGVAFYKQLRRPTYPFLLPRRRSLTAICSLWKLSLRNRPSSILIGLVP